MSKLYNLIFYPLLILFTLYLLANTFLIQKVYNVVDNEAEIVNLSEEIISRDDYYKDDNIEITLTTYREYDTNIYVTDVYLK